MIQLTVDIGGRETGHGVCLSVGRRSREMEEKRRACGYVTTMALMSIIKNFLLS